ncbi:sigma factor-like helix-turn-helix DNA-binding protein [Streptosporangium sp. G11]|uniref:sigma factor-like helix-turn-helix DNA-binding protein n=1 Tax=Streptosporangium sp. G11 TaxID=3436926 RepID=UPI003EBB6111
MSNTPPDTPSRATAGFPAGTAGETATRVFTDHRELLFSIVYSMLGSVADTEDVLQETWLAWAPRNHRPTADSVADPVGDPVTDSVTDPVANSTTDPVTDSTTDPVANSTTDPVTDPTTEPVANSTTDSITDPTTDPTTDPVADQVPDPVAGFVVDQVSDSRAHPIAGPIANPRAYLVRIAVNAALARQAAIRRRRETYVGPWLPEPLVTAASTGHDAGHGTDNDIGHGIGTGNGIGHGNGHDAAEPILRAESVSMALLVVLETLTPLERAVFVLYEVFGYAHTEIADILGRSPSAVRQLAHRAREHVQARRPRYRTDPRVRRQATERFLAAALGGDLDALMEILAPDVTMWTDGGGKVRASVLRPVRGRDKVARLIVGVTSHTPKNIDIRYRTVNGDPSALLFADDAPFAVMVVDLTAEGDQVAGIYAVTNPEKLSSIPREPEGTK